MGVGLPAAITCRLHAHQTRILAVLHVALQDTVLDQYSSAGRRAFVVHSQRAPTIGNRAVVNDGHARRSDALAHETGERGRFLAVEVAFQSVADGFMQKNAGQPGPSTTSKVPAGAGTASR